MRVPGEAGAGRTPLRCAIDGRGCEVALGIGTELPQLIDGPALRVEAYRRQQQDKRGDCLDRCAHERRMLPFGAVSFTALESI